MVARNGGQTVWADIFPVLNKKGSRCTAKLTTCAKIVNLEILRAASNLTPDQIVNDISNRERYLCVKILGNIAYFIIMINK